jgi:hypothetical protein
MGGSGFLRTLGTGRLVAYSGKKKKKKRHTDYFPVNQLLLKLFQTRYRECREHRVIHMNRKQFYFTSKKLIIVFCVA